MLLAVHHLYPSLRPYTAPFFQLSYYQASQGVYVQGWDDIYFVASSAIAFTAIRAIVIDWVLRPIAMHAGLKRKASVRFAEQGWMWLYYAFFWTFGMVRTILLNRVPAPDTDRRSSTFGRTPTTGWILPPSGMSGLLAASQARSSGISWRSFRSGCNRFLSSTSRSGEKTTIKCSPITS